MVRKASTARGAARRGRRKLEPSDAVRQEWLRRVEAEYASAAITQHLTLWLMQIGASPDLVKEGLRIAWDEMTHARISHRAYVAAGGHGVPTLARERLGLRRSEGDPLEHDVTRVVVTVFCVGETVAVALFKNLRQHCTVAAARRVLDRLLRDEVRHRDFGWTLLEWLLGTGAGPELRDVAGRALPRGFADARRAYGSAVRGETSAAEIAAADRAWGLMPPADYAAALERTLKRDWIPRFGRLGIDAHRAWDGA